MKKIFFAGLLVAVMGCASSIYSVKYAENTYSETNPADVKIFEFLPPEIQAQYEPIGEIHAVNRNYDVLRLEASKMGGDIVFIRTESTAIGVNKYGGIANRRDQSCLVLRRK